MLSGVPRQQQRIADRVFLQPDALAEHRPNQLRRRHCRTACNSTSWNCGRKAAGDPAARRRGEFRAGSPGWRCRATRAPGSPDRPPPRRSSSAAWWPVHGSVKASAGPPVRKLTRSLRSATFGSICTLVFSISPKTIWMNTGKWQLVDVDLQVGRFGRRILARRWLGFRRWRIRGYLRERRGIARGVADVCLRVPTKSLGRSLRCGSGSGWGIVGIGAAQLASRHNAARVGTRWSRVMSDCQNSLRVFAGTGRHWRLRSRVTQTVEL